MQIFIFMWSWTSIFLQWPNMSRDSSAAILLIKFPFPPCASENFFPETEMLCNSLDCYIVHEWKKEQRKKMLKLHELVHVEMQFLDGLTLEWCVKLWRLLQKCAREGTKTTAPSSEKFMSETGMMCKCSGCYKVVHKWRNKMFHEEVWCKCSF